jgi:hypothetical protein
MTLTAETVGLSDGDETGCIGNPKRVNGWYLLRKGAQTTVCRHIPARFDFDAKTILPIASSTRLAHQIRQDLWRALQNVRGFSPVVQITRTQDGLEVRAGGRVMGGISPKLALMISDVLEDPEKRARWMRCAALRGAGK